MTRPAQPIQAVSAVMADRYATAAAMAAREAARAAKMAVHPGRAQNVAAQFISGAKEAAMTGSKHQQVIEAGTGDQSDAARGLVFSCSQANV
jgi:hypothetical protein